MEALSNNICRSFEHCTLNPEQLRWKPFALPKEGETVDFVEGFKALLGAGSPAMRAGIAIYIYCANTSMKNRAMYNADGDLLFGL